MKRFTPVVVPLLVLGVVLLVSCHKQKTAEVLYHCPMHPTYVSDKPGDCPICGMRLVPIKGQSSAGEQASPTPTPIETGVPPEEAPSSSKPGTDGLAPVTLEPEGIARSGIQTTVAASGSLGEPIRAVGTVVPDERLVTHVHTKVSGWIERLFVNFTGQYVAKDQPLLEIYSPELLASQEEYLRARTLAERLQGSGSQQVTQEASELVAAARQRLLLFDVPEELIRQLDTNHTPSRTVVLRAPSSGYALGKEIFSGKRVEPGMELYTVVDLSRVWVEADFYEQEASLLRLSIPAKVTLPYQPGNAFSGRITYVYPSVNPESRTVRVRVELPNPHLQLKPDMYAHVEVEPRPLTGVVVPDSAVLDTGTRQLVFVEEKPGFFVPREVSVAHRAQGRALVSQGLAVGERVVVQGTFLVDSESRLRAAMAANQGGSHDSAHH